MLDISHMLTVEKVTAMDDYDRLHWKVSQMINNMLKLLSTRQEAQF